MDSRYNLDMPSATQIIRARRVRRQRTGFGQWGFYLLLATLFVFIITLGWAVTTANAAYLKLTAAFPPPTALEQAFAGEAYQPVRVYDRSGQNLLFEVIHPSAVQRRWYPIDPSAPISLPNHTIQATLASEPTDFWASGSIDPLTIWAAMRSDLYASGEQTPPQTLTQRLVTAQLVPFDGSSGSQRDLYIQSALLAAEIEGKYPKEKILEWYLNSADYGYHAYGIDTAAWTYLGKPATELSLAESALLAPIPKKPTQNPWDDLKAAKQQQAETLAVMVERGMISPAEQAEALDAEIQLLPPSSLEARELSGSAAILLEGLRSELGTAALSRSGLRVLSTIDFDLQRQAQCALASHLERLSGASPDAVVHPPDGGCLSAGLLPPLRPGDVGVDHQLDDGAAIVFDSETGEVLSAVGTVGSARLVGSAFYPFVYLTAFSQGYAPGTMVLDLPSDPSGQGQVGTLEENGFHGPVRMRTALANLYSGAAAKTVELVGIENLLSTAQTMGLIPDSDPTVQSVADISIPLLDLSAASAIIANEGNRVGVANDDHILPAVILEVEDATGRLVYQHTSDSSPILSQQLAFLMTHTMSDEAARWPSLGPSNPLEIGRPAGAVSGSGFDGRDFWTIGFTPDRVVGVRVSREAKGIPKGVTTLNGAAPIWHALMKYAVKDLPGKSWERPPGISEVEVCDPSGLLPTDFCPKTVREVYISGTEPMTTDNLYRPYRINRETNKLATLYTPVELVEERVYLLPPPEALAWAEESGLEKPPEEYDTIYQEEVNPDVRITSPQAFEFVRGDVPVRGIASSEDFDFYRLQYGSGLNPDRWVQIGEGVYRTRQGLLGTWETAGLDGLYTLQLLVVGEEGQVISASHHVTVDNDPPEITQLWPDPSEIPPYSVGEEGVFQVDVVENYGLKEVVFTLNDRVIARMSDPPYSTRYRFDEPGEFVLSVWSIDEAGNYGESEPLTLIVIP